MIKAIVTILMINRLCGANVPNTEIQRLTKQAMNETGMTFDQLTETVSDIAAVQTYELFHNKGLAKFCKDNKR